MGVEVHEFAVDLSDLQSVRSLTTRLGAWVAQNRHPIDVLLANAGAQFADARGVSAQGIEKTFAVNVVAQHELLRGVSPSLNPDAHVILMGSSGHRGRRATYGLLPSPSRRDPELLATPDLTVYGRTSRAGGTAYSDSKFALVTLAHEWAERIGASRRLNVYDPGLVPGTGLGRSMPAYKVWVWENLMPAMSILPGAATPNRTAKHAVALALGDTHATLTGGYVELGRESRAANATFDPDRRRRMWNVTDRLATSGIAAPQLPR